MKHGSSVWRWCAASIVLCLVLGGTAVLAQQVPAPDPQQPRIDRSQGEQDQIDRRLEWFYSGRREGTASDDEMWRLRRDGVNQTRRDMALQEQRRQVGAEATQNVWVSMGPSPSTFGNWNIGNVAGRIQAIASDWERGILYAGAASGGVWKSFDDGLSWTHIFDNAGTTSVGAIAVDPIDPDVLWVGTGDNIVSCSSYFGIGLLRSADGGQTWEVRNGSGGKTLEDLGSFASIMIDPRDSDRIVVGGRYRTCQAGQQNGGIYTTEDGGLTWTRRLGGLQIHEIARDPSNPDILWAAVNNGAWKSVDNGVSWTRLPGLPGTNGRVEIAIAPSDPQTVYVLYSAPSFWRTNDGGATWDFVVSGDQACDGQCSYNSVIRVDPTDRNTVYRGSIRLYRSVNAGGFWSDLTFGWGSGQLVHQDMQSMLMHPTDPNKFYIGSDGGLWKTEDAGATFTNINGNMNVTQFYAIGVDQNDPGRICGGAQDNSSLARDGSNVWDRQAVTGDGFMCHIDHVATSYAYITSYPSGGYPNVWRSTTGLYGGWSDITGDGSGVINGDRSNWVTPYNMDPVDTGTLYLGTHRVYRSFNRGNSWTLVSPDLTAGSGSLTTVEINRGFTTHLFTGSTSDRVWHSENSGDDWVDITAGLPGRNINDVAGDPTNPDRAFAVVSGFNVDHLWEWNDGAGWTARGTGLPNVPANSVLMLTANDILVGNDVGVFRSYDGGVSFVPFMDGLPEGLVVTDLKYVPNQNLVTIGTYGRGAWQMTVDPLQPILLADSVEQPLIELDGDGDSVIEPGETWSVRPLVQNAGGEPAMDVSATLFTSTPGVTILGTGNGSYGDLGPGASGPATASVSFVVDPTFACGESIVFDLVGLSSSNPPGSHGDQDGFFSVIVQEGNEDSVASTLFEDDFDPDPEAGWTHQAVNPGLPGCFLPFKDEWGVETKDVGHAQSYHAGNGPGSNYSLTDFSWLHPFGRDSEDGPGITIPLDAVTARLTIVHWYDTAMGEDGGQVVFDSYDDDEDLYVALDPIGGYDGTVGMHQCNGLQGQEAFMGSSGGWVETTFDLTKQRGRKLYLAFVFGSDQRSGTGEGWYVDDVRLEYYVLGAPACDTTLWPGTAGGASFSLVAPDTIEATWGDSCNIGEFPTQGYSIQAGSLDLLRASGTYTHAPVGGECDRASGATFTPGVGNQYYLIVPAGEGREGGAGADFFETARPQTSLVCGERRVGCP